MGPNWHYRRVMQISHSVEGVNLTELGAKVGLSRRTMFRWVKEGIPGREPEQKLWADRIERAAKKLRARNAEAA